MSLRPSPSTSPSPAPPNNTTSNLKPINARASLQPQAIPRVSSGQQQNPISPRPGINTGHGRPTSELLSGSNGMFQTPECKPQTSLAPTYSQFVPFSGQPKQSISGLKTYRIMRLLSYAPHLPTRFRGLLMLRFPSFRKKWLLLPSTLTSKKN